MLTTDLANRQIQLARCAIVAASAIGWGAVSSPAQTAGEPASLPAYVINSTQVANQAPTGTLGMPVSGLRYEPRVDVQARNLAESQADVSIRGGIFESTGFKIGALTVYDPQTGHYFAELPIAPAMLAPPRVLVGAENSLGSFNAGVGTIAYGWRPIQNRGELSLGAGEYGFNHQSLYQGFELPVNAGDLKVSADIDLSRSESDGSRPFGDHDFQRAAGRVQIVGANSQTDAFAGYQSKFFGWPNLYTPFNFNESENLQTVLVALNHRVAYAGDSWLQAGAYYRRHKDDYEFNRPVPGAFNPFQHTTHVRGGALEGRHSLGTMAVNYSAAWMSDSLQSTSLTFGRFTSRDYYRAGAVAEFNRGTDHGNAVIKAGAMFDDTNRDGSSVSPVLSAALTTPLQGGGERRLYVEYAENSQVATYTALNSSSASGLFRGNQSLGRESTRNLEIGASVSRGSWFVEAAAFHRWEDDLVDWTFRRGVTARTANAVDIGVFGFETVAAYRTARLDLVLGYTFLEKDGDYGSASVDASFYALNFARHRLTAAAIWRIGGGFEIRADNEYRLQEENILRTAGGDEAVLTTIGIHYIPLGLRSLELSLQVDNLWDSDFQEVPAVPSGRRQFAGGVSWRW